MKDDKPLQSAAAYAMDRAYERVAALAKENERLESELSQLRTQNMLLTRKVEAYEAAPG